MQPKNIVICSFLLLQLCKPVISETGWIEIPLGLEPSIQQDSFIPYMQPERPTIALALSGGGARGFAQIGVLKVFEKYGLPVDGIVGTSMGAIVGGLYAVGYTSAEIESLAHEIRWDDLMQNAPHRTQLFLGQKEEKADHFLQLRLKGLSLYLPSAVTAGHRLSSLVTNLILHAPKPLSENFGDLHIPFRAVTTDLLSGKKVVLQDGSLINALRASMAIPLLFTPVRRDSALLVDGGLLQNMPVSEAKEFGTDLVVAIDTSSKLRNEDDLDAPWTIADQATTIMQHDIVLEELSSADIAIQPAIEGISNSDFHHIDALIQAGVEAAEAAAPEIESRLSVYSSRPDTVFRIQQTRISGCIHLNPSTFLNQIAFDSLHYATSSQIVWAGRSLMQSGLFQDVKAFIDTTSKTLTFEVTENPYIEAIHFLGNTILPDSILMKIMETFPGQVINVHQGRRDLGNIIEQYHNQGYPFARIDSTTISQKNLYIFISEGVIGDIHLEGNCRTRPLVIMRELPLRQGDLLNVSELERGLENIYSSGYFESVSFNAVQKGSKYDLTLNLVERASTLFRLGSSYDLERRFQGWFHLVEENLFGLGDKGSVTGLMGSRDRLLRARLWSDRFLNTYLTYRLDVAYTNREFKFYQNHERIGLYEQSSIEGSIKIGQQMRRLGTLSLEYKSEDINVRALEGDATPDESRTIRSICLRSEVDSRDRVPFPSSGHHHVLQYEWAGKGVGSPTEYSKIHSSMEIFYAIKDRLIIHPRLTWGTANASTPFSKQYRLGGLDSFMGMAEEALIGKLFIAFNGEMRFRLPWPDWLESYLSLRYDFGGLWQRYSRIDWTDFKQAVGCILSINTPLGPFRFGYGYSNDRVNRIYFSAGYRL